jgi:hypothetical protein
LKLKLKKISKQFQWDPNIGRASQYYDISGISAISRECSGTPCVADITSLYFQVKISSPSGFYNHTADQSSVGFQSHIQVIRAKFRTVDATSPSGSYNHTPDQFSVGFWSHDQVIQATFQSGCITMPNGGRCNLTLSAECTITVRYVPYSEFIILVNNKTFSCPMHVPLKINSLQLRPCVTLQTVGAKAELLSIE